MTRYGKIARLHACIREQLGERMERGEGGAGLLAWLNSLPQVKQVLAEEFGAVPISKQNLSEWRQGGYRDWRAHRDTMAQVRQLVSDSQDLEEFMDEKPLADHLATLVAVRYAAVLSNTNGEAQDRHQIRALRGLLRDIIDLRRSDHNAQRLKMERERWEFERRKLEEQAEKQARYRAEDRVLAPFNAAERAAQLTEAFGGSEAAKRVAARAAEVGYDLPCGFLSRKDEPVASSGSEVLADCQGLSRSPTVQSEVLADGQESNQVKPSQSESREVKPEGEREDGGESETSNIERSTSNIERSTSNVERSTSNVERSTSNVERSTSNVDLAQSQSSLSGADGRERAQRAHDENEDGEGVDGREVNEAGSWQTAKSKRVKRSPTKVKPWSSHAQTKATHSQSADYPQFPQSRVKASQARMVEG